MPHSPYPATELRTATFADDLARHGDRIALITGRGELSYRDLAARVTRFRARLGDGRRLVLLEGANTVDALVAYLAALAAGHPVLLTPGGTPGAVASLIAAYDPDVVVRAAEGPVRVDQRHAVPAHVLHPDLALLLSTSGSTGSPKLVRLSYDNLQANAESIAGYLGIRTTDRAATTLPMHYCYGLSVINSHLLRGAALILTELSVADSCFWDLFRRNRGTTFAAVPYTFDLLDRVGFAAMRLPDLRYVTQAGGRLAPDRVRGYAELGQRNGWDLFVMYGQTEATARMAYLPPDLAASHPYAIGVPIPGGTLRLDPLPDGADPGTGELVYAGPNVMLGYAESPTDLGLGRTVDELRTGDLARRTDDGLYELVGRRNRLVKIFGLRIDLQRVEAMLERHGLTACCVGTDDELIVAVEGGGDATDLRRLVARECGLPARAVRVCVLDELPRLPTGKPDQPAIRALTTPAPPLVPVATVPTAAGTDLRDLYAEVLDRSDVTDDSSFVSLGGDSLSYVEMSLRLEQALGYLPSDWHTATIGDLRPAAHAPDAVGPGGSTPGAVAIDAVAAGPAGVASAVPWRRSAGRRTAAGRSSVDTSVVLRAIAIVLIVGSHIQLLDLPGGAHVLIGVAGFNFARFHLTCVRRRERVRNLAASIRRIVVPSVLWIALVYLLTDDYGLENVFLLNEVLGPIAGTERYFWFVETLVYLLLAMLALVSLPIVDRVERRHPFALPAALVVVALVARYDLPLVEHAVRLPTPVVVFWLFAAGWAAAKATTNRQRLCVTVAIVATVPGFFGKPVREVIVIAGLCLLVWVSSVPSHRVLNRAAGLLAGASLYIYLTHWHVYPYLDDYSGVLALIASLVAGIGYAMAAKKLTAVLRRARPAGGRSWRVRIP